MNAADLNDAAGLLFSHVRHSLAIEVAQLKTSHIDPAVLALALEKVADYCEELRAEIGGPDELGDVKTDG